MPSDFRIGYPCSVQEYRDKSGMLSKDLNSAIFSEAACEMGPALWNYKENDFGFVDERFAAVRDKFIQCL